ncbi:hypothetical protein PFFVO_00622 [Plasmodium falciparum Vietnam Oak-Knoll (FVO)]|uniref:Uncharacterized protein n=1 Tax=Plasmodium falciparum Vietnam Oak-Knoll (FVO) TaxID=1036723 RepID=A0A024VCV9_PLAFA|nr:hypothetical protein PFFVO_00622 [Plasmodium falciparum Vietnam Oak-Knoll (FVO)]
MKKEKKRKQKKNNNIIIKKIKLLIFTILFPFYEYIYKNVLLELYKIKNNELNKYKNLNLYKI